MATRSEEHKTNEQKNIQKGQEQAPSREMTPSHRGRPASHGALEPFYRLREEFDRFFDQLAPGWLGPWEGSRTAHWGLDMQEDDGRVVIRAEAPGFEPSDFDIHVRGDRLVLHAAHKVESEEKERGVHEWRQQEFYRSVTLPADVDADKVEATYRNGILSVSLPKSEQHRGRRIEVKT
jgi:HSP20 family protein